MAKKRKFGPTLHMEATLGWLRQQLRFEEQTGKPQRIFGQEGNHPSYNECYAELARLEQAGFEVVPMGPCNNQDAKGHCLGH